MSVFAIIPARSGSKSVPKKNIHPLGGKSLIAYTIESAENSKLIDRFIVSTDDEEIKNIAEEYGAEVPFLRPSKYAQDNTPDLPVFQHALRWFEKHEGYTPKIVVHLRPTSPLRTSEHINKGIKLLMESPDADSIRSVCTPCESPFKMWKIDERGYLTPLIKLSIDEPYNAPRQELPEVYWQCGYVDVTRYETIMEKCSMTGKKILPLIIDEPYCIDIDSYMDFKIAEALLKK